MNKKRLAIIGVNHYESSRSIKRILEAVGYKCLGVSRALAFTIKRNTKQHISPDCLDKTATIEDLKSCDLYVTEKHFFASWTLHKFKYLKDKILWFTINQGYPGCQLKGPQKKRKEMYKALPAQPTVPVLGANFRYSGFDNAYTCYPPLPPSIEKIIKAGSRNPNFEKSPVGLLNSARSWGYKEIFPELNRMSRIYGKGNPKGFIRLDKAVKELHTSPCFIHPKSCDCPGYALLMALACGCPPVLPAQFVERSGFYNICINGKTCLAVDDPKIGRPMERADLQGLIEATEKLTVNKTLNKRMSDNCISVFHKHVWREDKDLDPTLEFFENNFWK